MRRSHLLAALLVIVATPVATWWVVGDQSEDAPPGMLSYSYEPPPLEGAAMHWLGGGATAVAVVALGVLALGTVRGTVDLARWLVLAPLVILGAIVGMSYRVMTAGVVGADIGAGFVILGLPVACIALLSTAGTAWHVHVRGPRAQPPYPGAAARGFSPPASRRPAGTDRR